MCTSKLLTTPAGLTPRPWLPSDKSSGAPSSLLISYLAYIIKKCDMPQCLVLHAVRLPPFRDPQRLRYPRAFSQFANQSPSSYHLALQMILTDQLVYCCNMSRDRHSGRIPRSSLAEFNGLEFSTDHSTGSVRSCLRTLICDPLTLHSDRKYIAQS